MQADLMRLHRAEETGIYVRARHPVTQKWGAYDIAQLEKASLIEWLRDMPSRAEQIILLMLGYPEEQK